MSVFDTAPILPPALPLGARTKWGLVSAVMWLEERYYFMVNRAGHVAMMPATVVEPPENRDAHLRLAAWRHVHLYGTPARSAVSHDPVSDSRSV